VGDDTGAVGGSADELDGGVCPVRYGNILEQFLAGWGGAEIDVGRGVKCQAVQSGPGGRQGTVAEQCYGSQCCQYQDRSYENVGEAREPRWLRC
jgi:hypothetical protein